MGRQLFLVLFVIIAVSFITNVSAIGVSPGRVSLDYSPNLDKTVSITLVNTEERDVNVVLAVQGELAEHITLNQEMVSMTEEETSKDLSYNIKLPQGLEPGLHTARVVMLQLPEESENTEAYIGAAFAVVTQVHVFVPYPGKHAEASLYVLAPNEQGRIKFIIPIESKGLFEIVKAEATIDIYDSYNELVKTLKTNTEKIPSKEGKELFAIWDAREAAGDYRAVATVTYDEETLTLEKEFSVGLRRLQLQNIEVNDFVLGDIAKFDIYVKNEWTGDVKGVFAEMEIYNEKGLLLDTFSSPTYDISAFKTIKMVSFWDTKGVRKGMYDATLYLKYGESIEQQDIKLNIDDYELNVVGFGYNFKTGDVESNTFLIVLISAIVILVLANLSWFFLLRRKILEKRRKPPKMKIKKI